MGKGCCDTMDLLVYFYGSRSVHLFITKIIDSVKNNEASGGILIMIAAFLALLAQNTFLSDFYHHFLHTQAGVVVGEQQIIRPVILWVNEGLMALFFFFIGLEVKRELLVGELSQIKQVVLPLAGGLGGVIAPALLFLLFTLNDSFAAQGWAIPTVSDTAFAIGVLMLLKEGIPYNLKSFLLLLAVIDDVCVVLIVALFYSHEVSFPALLMVSFVVLALWWANWKNSTSGLVYAGLCLLLWVFMLESGVHSTLAGIIAAMFIPLKGKNDEPFLEEVKASLNAWVVYFVMPIFAFVNAGIGLSSEAFSGLLHPVSLGIFLGLVIAKPLGIFAFSYAAVKLRLAVFPKGCSHQLFLGICALTGIGASMSLFIDGIAYNDSDVFAYADKLSILLASLVSGVGGYWLLRRAIYQKQATVSSYDSFE